MIELNLNKMSKDRQPFTEFATQPKSSPGSSKVAWVGACFIVGLLIAGGYLWNLAETRRQSSVALQSSLVEASNRLAQAVSDSEQAKGKIAALQTQVTELAKEKERVGQTARGLEDEMRAAMESRDVTISKLQGKLTVNILDRVMFDSGEAIMKPDGEAVLRKIAEVLTGHPELKIQVIGHTDNVPIRNRFPSNWELSASRALAAVHFLTEKAGVDPKRVGAVGYGEYRPIADNATPEGRARNRRIAVTILPDEFAQADAVPNAVTNAVAEPKIPAVVPAATNGTPVAPPEPPAK